MTPAEKAAAAKKPRKCGTSKPRQARSHPWRCELRTYRQRLLLSMRDVAEGVGMTVSTIHSMRDVAEGVGMKVSTIHQIENGTDPMLTTAKLLAAFFGVTVEAMWPRLKKEKE